MSSSKFRSMLLVAFAVLTIIFGSLYTFELVKGPTSTTITSSTTFTETETVTSYITNQFFRTTSFTTPLTTSFPWYNVHFTVPDGVVVVSSWVVENGIMLNLTCTPFFKVGDTFIFFVTMENVNSSSHLSLLEAQGNFNITIYDSKGARAWRTHAFYAAGPTGPPPPSK